MSVNQIKQAHGELAIWSRVLLNDRESITPELARYFLSLGFGEEDKSRMHELAVKNQDGKISEAELLELDSFIKVGDVMAILQSHARQLLKASKSRARHG